MRLRAALCGLLLAACGTAQRPERVPATSMPPPAPVASAPTPAPMPSAPAAPVAPPAAPPATVPPAAPAPAQPAAAPLSTPAPAAAAPAPPPVVAKPPVAKPAPPKPAPPPTAAPLDLKSLEQRLRATSAIGVLTKLSLKNQVDDLVARFRSFHQGARPPTLAELRPAYELLLMKVLSLLQDADATLARDINASREAIWGVLTDRDKLSSSL